MVKVKDLTAIEDKDYVQRDDELLYCFACRCEYGGTRGDFWLLPEERVLSCPQCRRPLDLVRKKVSYIEVKK